MCRTSVLACDCCDCAGAAKICPNQLRQIGHVQVTTDEIRFARAVRIAGDRGHAVELPFVGLLACVHGEDLRAIAGNGHVVLPQAGRGAVQRGCIFQRNLTAGTQPNRLRLAFHATAEDVEFLAADAQHIAQQAVAGTRVATEPRVEILVDQAVA